ncbi:PE-PGRS family protein [Streptomyces sp. Li-HN-5-11]|uniref:PE-PGRS family protein n=1 Tax=Streptomyces sp. Li-HN-5-11 TaxID=3075432 RepID=UPI0028A5ACDC|nr:PE-PGRS family protein [Streptomyces sp. Li-HN-5-11]WNM33533.1 PE-PGRS family protein [Streptomyces sp. Li-HN-5-11]
MNRMGLGLAIGAGYLLGRTKKLKMAVAVGSLVAGKKMNLGPRAIADLVNQQLKDNPQFKEIGDQLRQDLRGVGKAASGAMVERQMSALADRLHGRTAQVRDQLAGVAPDTGGGKGSGGEEPEGDYRDEYDDREGREAEDESESDGGSRAEGGSGSSNPSGAARELGAAGKQAAKKAPGKRAPVKKAAQQAPAKKAAKKAPAKKAAAKKTSAGKTAAKKTAAAGNATRGVRSRLPKGGGDR